MTATNRARGKRAVGWRRWLVVGRLALAGGAVGQAQADPTQLPAHDPSRVVNEAGRYWMFSTGPGCRTAWSTNRTDWVRGPRVFAEPPEWWRTVAPGNRGDAWAPDLITVNGRYYLYYSVSVFGRNTSAIGLATSPTLDPAAPGFGWRDDGVVIQSRAGDDFNAIDPAPFLDVDGRLWLAFGSFWSGIQLIELDRLTGRRLAPDSPRHWLAHTPAIEAPYLHRHDGWYYLFVNWGTCCRGLDSTYEVRVGRSREVTGPYRDRDGVAMTAGGGMLFRGAAGRFVGPGHVGVFTAADGERVGMHFYDRLSQGAARFDWRRLGWEADGWPQVLDGPAGGPED